MISLADFLSIVIAYPLLWLRSGWRWIVGLDLTANLISEAIGIAITVFLVDRTIALRRRRRWRHVRSSFMHAAAYDSRRLLLAWQEWLLALAKRHISPLDSIDARLYTERQRCASAGAEALKGVLGDPVGQGLWAFARKTDVPIGGQDLWRSLHSYLMERMWGRGTTSLSLLVTELSPPAHSLAELIARFASVVDPEPALALSIIKMSLFVTALQANMEHDGEWTTRHDGQGSLLARHIDDLMKGLNETLLLFSYIERELERDTAASPFWMA